MSPTQRSFCLRRKTAAVFVVVGLIISAAAAVPTQAEAQDAQNYRSLFDSILNSIGSAIGELSRTIGSFMRSQPAQVSVVTNGLVGYWAFDSGSGSTAQDSSGSGNDGAINGASWTTGKWGGALSFDGSDSVSLGSPSNIDGAGSVTLAAWVKTNDSAQLGTILGGDPNWRNPTLYQTRYTGWTGRLRLGGSNYELDWGQGGVQANRWYHLAMTYDGSTLRLYIDGSEAASDGSPSGSLSATGDVRYIGDGSIGTFNGVIDDVRYYNRALSASEISSLYNASDSSGSTDSGTSDTTQTSGDASVSGQNGSVGKWGRHVISITQSSYSGNPFELEVDATFTHSSGDRITLPGYYDGNDTWKIAFMPRRTGDWDYTTSSSDDDLDGISGTVSASSSNSPGMLKAASSGSKKWKFTDGGYVVPIALRTDFFSEPATASTFRSAADFLENNNIHMLETRLTEEYGQFGGRNDFIFEGDWRDHRFDLDIWQRMEERMNTLAARDLGAHIMFYSDDQGAPDWGGRSETERLLIRYAVARLASYPVVWFNTGIDIREYRSQTDINWLGEQVRSMDPYGHPISSRHGGGSGTIVMSGQTFDSYGDPNTADIDGILGRYQNANVPVSMDDAWGENRSSHPAKDHRPADIRRAFWKQLMAGGVGGLIRCSGTGGSETGFCYLSDIQSDLESEQWLKLINPFIADELGGTFGSMEPANSLVSGGYALADGSRSKILFYSIGTNDRYDSDDAGITLQLSGISGTYSATWFNPRTGGKSSAGTISGGSSRSMSPSSSDDWVLLLSKTSSSESGTSADQPPPSEVPSGSTLIWDGEDTSKTLQFVNGGGYTTSEPHTGSRAFAGPRPVEGNAFTWPGLWFNNPRRVDISNADELWFWIKATRSDVTTNVTIRESGASVPISPEISITPYIEGGSLSTNYRLVKIPISAFRKDGFQADEITHMIFQGPGSQYTGPDHTLYVDDIYAVGSGGDTTQTDSNTGEAGTVAGDLPLSVSSVTSSSANLSWGNISGASSIRVYVAPEPSQSSNTDLPSQKLVATLGGSAASYTVRDLAAAVDVFFRVEADTPSGVLASNAHARTVGGPRANLSTPLREVHAYAPDILMLTLEDKRVESFSTGSGDFFDNGRTSLVGYDGPTWQSGGWTITRRDGSAISVEAVYRDSVPAGNNYYETGFGAYKNQHLMDVDHNIFLKLSEPIGSRDVLTVNGPLNLKAVVPFSDKYLETPVIQVNQVGYSPRASRRYAYVSGWMGDGGALGLANFPSRANVLREPSNELQGRSTALGGLSVTTRSNNDSDAGTAVKQINLSTLPASNTATYRVQLPGVGVSWDTRVSEQAVFDAYYTIARGFYYNRWGRDLKQPYTDFGPRPPDHPTVYTSEYDDPFGKPAETTPKTGERPLTGGHHDAGDFDIRITHDVMPIVLLRAIELNMGALEDGQLNIPESGNGIPDLLDEVLYNLRAWQQLQESDGGIRMGAESYRHPLGYHYADEDPLPYWARARGPYHTLRIAGVLAQASRLTAPYNSAKAAELEKDAAAAYEYARANGVQDSITGPMLYAAGELYAVTGETKYKDVFERIWGDGMVLRDFFDWQGYYHNESEQPALTNGVMGYLQGPNPDPDVVQSIKQQIASSAEDQLNNMTDNAHRNGRRSGGSATWGRATAVGRHIGSVFPYLQLDEAGPSKTQELVNAMSLSADYVLGANPMGMTWITALGDRHPEDPLHLDALTFLKDGFSLLPGIPVYGPVDGLSGQPYYEYGRNVFYPSMNDRPHLRRYGDLNIFVQNNEFDVGPQALQVQLFASLLAPDDNYTPPEPDVSETPSEPVQGDFNGDGFVNSLDWSIMRENWNSSNSTADLNGDGTVNTVDFSIINRNWST